MKNLYLNLAEATKIDSIFQNDLNPLEFVLI